MRPGSGMYSGKIVELAPTLNLFSHARHPYTQALLRSIPSLDPARRRAEDVLGGDVPSQVEPPSGCRFHPRCSYATQECVIAAPTVEEVEVGIVWHAFTGAP